MNTWIRSGMCSDVGGGGGGAGRGRGGGLLQAVQAEAVLHVRVGHQRRGVLQQAQVVQVQPRAQLRLLAAEHARVQLARVVCTNIRNIKMGSSRDTNARWSIIDYISKSLRHSPVTLRAKGCIELVCRTSEHDVGYAGGRGGRGRRGGRGERLQAAGHRVARVPPPAPHAHAAAAAATRRRRLQRNKQPITIKSQ